MWLMGPATDCEEYGHDATMIEWVRTDASGKLPSQGGKIPVTRALFIQKSDDTYPDYMNTTTFNIYN